MTNQSNSPEQIPAAPPRPDDGGRRAGPDAMPPQPGDAQDHRTPCADIQELLFDYMSRELGAARSDLVRQHLRKCPDCQRVAADMQATLDLMRRVSQEETPRIPDHLSEDRRRRMIRAVTHPILDWMNRHHILVSILVAAAVMTVLALFLRTVHMGRTDIPRTGYPIRIDGGPPAAGGGDGDSNRVPVISGQ